MEKPLNAPQKNEGKPDFGIALIENSPGSKADALHHGLHEQVGILHSTVGRHLSVHQLELLWDLWGLLGVYLEGQGDLVRG